MQLYSKIDGMHVRRSLDFLGREHILDCNMLDTIGRSLCSACRVKTADLLILDDCLVRAIVIIAIEPRMLVGECSISSVSAFTAAPQRSRCREKFIFVKRIEIHLLGQRAEGYRLLGEKFKPVI